MATEASEWKPTIVYRALASRVLIVATTRVEGGWNAFCDAVPGERHRDEIHEVLRHGDLVDERLARLLFPEFEELPYAW